MLVSDTLLVFRIIPFAESSIIIKGFTALNGSQSFMANGIRKRKASMSASLFHPLALLDVVSYQKPQVSLHKLKEARLKPGSEAFLYPPDRNIWIQLWCEIVFYSLADYPPDLQLFNWLEKTLKWLNAPDFEKQFFPEAMLTLGQYLGISPIFTEFSSDSVFLNLQEGVFEQTKRAEYTYAREETTCLVKNWLQNKQNNTPINLLIVIEDIVRYFQYHLPAFKRPQSLSLLTLVV